MLWKTIFAFKMTLLLLVVDIEAAPLMFPLTLGGFAGNTYIE
jgi:hypothetical protein